MAEQAEKLRRWVASQTAEAARQVLTGRLAGARVLAVTSGKGGVGKSSLTLNLALALAVRGQRVVLFDADLGLANINILLGYQPSSTIWDVIQGRVRLRDIILTGPLGVRIIPGGTGIVELAQLEHVEILGLIEGFQDLEGECDWLMIDTGAGISDNVLSFVLAADEALVVTNPEPTALADAYGLIKAVWEAGGRVELKLVMNRVANWDKARQMGERLTRLADTVLGHPVRFLGMVADDSHVGRAVQIQQPFCLAFPDAAASRDVGELANQLLNRVPPPRRGGWGLFLWRVLKHREIPGLFPEDGGKNQ